MAAAIEAYESGVKSIVVIERDKELGGIIQQCIHNGFGLHIFKEELTGPEYADRFIQQMKALGIEYKLNTMVLSMTAQKEVTFTNSAEGVVRIKAGAIILAMGCRERTRGALNIPGTRPAGILTAGTAQRFVNIEGYLPGKDVIILGSGDIGLIMARRLTLEGCNVKMVCELMPYSSGLTRNIVQCLDDYHIPLALSHTIVAIHGKERLEAVTIAQVDQEKQPIAGTERIVECDTLLLSVGLIPENELSKSAGISMDPVTSGPVVNESMETSVAGIFACGNVVHVHDLVDNVTRESALTGRSAARYVLNRKKGGQALRQIKTQAGKNISYVVPQLLRQEYVQNESKLFFRVNRVFKNANITLKSDDKVLYVKKMKRAVPGEMESIVLKPEFVEQATSDALTISIEQAEKIGVASIC